MDETSVQAHKPARTSPTRGLEGILVCEHKPAIISPTPKQGQNWSRVQTRIFGPTVNAVLMNHI